jgi:hypothetical protein
MNWNPMAKHLANQIIRTRSHHGLIQFAGNAGDVCDKILGGSSSTLRFSEAIETIQNTFRSCIQPERKPAEIELTSKGKRVSVFL